MQCDRRHFRRRGRGWKEIEAGPVLVTQYAAFMLQRVIGMRMGSEQELRSTQQQCQQQHVQQTLRVLSVVCSAELQHGGSGVDCRSGASDPRIGTK